MTAPTDTTTLPASSSAALNAQIVSSKTMEELTQIINEVTQAERITKAGLRVLSRELLAHAYEHGDITLINDLLGLDENGKFRLTPINWRIAVQYFNHFVAFTSNFDKEVRDFAIKGQGNRVALTFNKKSKDKYKRMLPTVVAWLGDETNDIWTWSNDAVMDATEVDYLKGIDVALAKAMDEEKGNHTLQSILAHIVDSNDNITLSDIAAFVATPTALEASDEAA